MKKPSRLNVLRRPKLRQSWNKYNLYNISQLTNPMRTDRYKTYFQQKFAAKSLARAYHGEHVGEKKWRRLFSRRLYTSVDMPPRYLAEYDGSEQGAGRGSGKEPPPGMRPPSALTYSHWDNELPRMVSRDHEEMLDFQVKGAAIQLSRDNVGELLAAPVRKITPYMQLLFWPLERRLDTAIFRALFASSVRQARQFIVHGAVTVNGLKMRHPHYMLNPGDLFQVDVEKVMYATGEPRSEKSNAQERERVETIEKAIKKLEADVMGRKAAVEGEGNAATDEENGGEAVDSNEAGQAGENNKGEERPAPGEEEEEEEEDMSGLTEEEKVKRRTRKHITKMLNAVRKLLAEKDSAKLDLSAKDKQELRLFRAKAKSLMPLFGVSAEEGKNELGNITRMLSRFTFSKNDTIIKTPQPEPKTEADSDAANAKQTHPEPVKEPNKEPNKEVEALAPGSRAKYEALVEEGLTWYEHDTLLQLLKEDDKNPLDDRKAYKTPWAPRPYMAAFAYIPRYLEVNQRACAAVYLRHPVARRGLGEVPTPFPYEINQLTYNWYLKWRL